MRLLLLSASMIALAATSAQAADMVEIVDIPEPVVAGFSWSGVYVGAHIGGVWGDRKLDSGCDAFRNLVREGGGAPTYESAGEIVPIEDDGFYSGPSDQADLEGQPGCFDVELDDGPFDDSEFEDDPVFPGFNLDGDFVALTEGFEGDADDDLAFLGGAQVGINWQRNRWVFGLEADASWIGDNGDGGSGQFQYFHDSNDLWEPWREFEDFEGTGTVRSESEMEWLATFRGRLGAALGDEGRLLIYGTGGVAVASVNNSIRGSFSHAGDSVDWCGDDCFFSNDDDDDDYQVGYAVGLGAEYALGSNWSVGLEYLFVGFDEDDSVATTTFHGDSGRSFEFRSTGVEDLHTIKLKLNYNFH